MSTAAAPLTTSTVSKKIDPVTRKKYNTTYYTKHKSAGSTVCVCGGKYSLFNLSHHRSTKRHLNFVVQSSTVPVTTPSVVPTTVPTTVPSIVPVIVPTTTPSVVPTVIAP
jgi:hypothetical protein